jgi:protein-disulfide isomerase
MIDEHEIVRLARPIDDYDHVLGPQSALATLVQYGDYECPYCRHLNLFIREILKRTEGVRFVYRHFPIRKLHPYAVRAAEGAEAASAQGRFWEMHNLLFETDQPLDDQYITLSARKAGLDLDRYTREMAEDAYAGRVEEAFKSALYSDGVTGTPTLYLNGMRLNSINSIEGLLAAVTEAGATLLTNSDHQKNWLSRLRRLRSGMSRLHS